MNRTVAAGTLIVAASALVCVAALASVVRPVRLASVDYQGWPDPAAMDSLGRYLRPVGEAPALERYGDFLPALPPVERPAEESEPAAPSPPQWRLTAILTTDGRAIAILNERSVRVGDALPGGGEVLAIERNSVVIREPGGTRRTVPLSSEGAE